ncbi:MAG: CRTAC1 family protein [Pyrinomonadaceae bacterium]
MRIPRSFATILVLLFHCSQAMVWAQTTSNLCVDRKIPGLSDVLKKTGIKFTHSSAPEKKYIVESMSGGVVLIDFDRDGWQDIYFPNAPTVEMALKGDRARSALYRNNGDGTFSDVAEKSGTAFPGFAMGGAVGDFNNDGWPDLYITCLGGNVLYQNNGNGTFTDVAKAAGVVDGRWSAGAAFGDFDKDGYLDLFVTNYVDFKLNDLPGFGSLPTCKFRGIDVQCGPRGLKGAGDSLYRNNGNGTFTEVAKAKGVDDPGGYYGMQIVWSDFGNRGKLDAYVANDSTANFLYRNEDQKFGDVSLTSGTAVSGDGSEQGSMGVAVGDYLHTGRFSIFVTNFVDEYNILYRNDGDYNFTDVSFTAKVAQASRPYVGWGAGFIDLDNDTWLDLLVVNGHVYPQMDQISSGLGYKQSKLLHMNLGNGTFCEASSQVGPALLEKRASRGAAFGDLDNDGNVDIVVGDLDAQPSILRNEGGSGNRWINLELSAIKGSPLAIGAKVKIVAGGVTQTEEIRSGGSYLSQNDLRIHFGLGKSPKADSIEITWPSGRVETLKDVAADKFYAVLEGSGIVPFQKVRPTGKK